MDNEIVIKPIDGLTTDEKIEVIYLQQQELLAVLASIKESVEPAMQVMSKSPMLKMMGVRL